MMLVCSFLHTVTASLRKKSDKNENKYELEVPFKHKVKEIILHHIHKFQKYLLPF